MAAKIVYYQNGERIIQTGSIEKGMYIILDGEVSISLSKGSDNFNVAILKKNDFFGEISLFNNTPRSANAFAIGNVKLVVIDNIDQLHSFLISNPTFAAKMVKTLAQRLSKTDELLIGKISELNRIKVTQDF